MNNSQYHVLFLFFLVFSTYAKTEKPNFLFILVDDMGYSNIGCYGSEIETPNLDNLAAKGLPTPSV